MPGEDGGFGMISGLHVIVGPPGTGKTTRVKRLVERDLGEYGHDKLLLCSLTKAAAAELAGRNLPVPERMVGTLHAHGYRTIGTQPIAEERLPEWNDWCRKRWELTKGKPGMDDPGYERRLRLSAAAEIAEDYNLLRHTMTPRDRWPSKVKTFAEQWEKWKKERGYVDYTDMIELALYEGSVAPGDPAVIYVDEAQDLSKLEQALIALWGQRAERVYMVGDGDQALFCWRGADPSIFNDVTLPSERRQVLSWSHRVPHAVHALATRWIARNPGRLPAEYRPRPVMSQDGRSCVCDGCRAPMREGVVRRHAASYDNPEPLLPMIHQTISEGRTVMVLASCAYMLANTIGALKKAGIPYHNPYQSDRNDWNPLTGGRGVSTAQRALAYLRPMSSVYGDDAGNWTPQDVKLWTELIKSDGVLRHGVKELIKRKGGMEMLSDRELLEWFTPDAFYDVMALMVEDDAPKALGWLKQHALAARMKPLEFPIQIARVYGASALAQEPSVVVGTIHSVKGGEADVVVLYPDMSPAGMEEWDNGGEGRAGVRRQMYVAFTRARQELVLCAPGSRRALEISA